VCRVWGEGFGMRVWHVGFEVKGLECRVWGVGLRVWGLGCRDWGAGLGLTRVSRWARAAGMSESSALCCA